MWVDIENLFAEMKLFLPCPVVPCDNGRVKELKCQTNGLFLLIERGPVPTAKWVISSEVMQIGQCRREGLNALWEHPPMYASCTPLHSTNAVLAMVGIDLMWRMQWIEASHA